MRCRKGPEAGFASESGQAWFGYIVHANLLMVGKTGVSPRC